MTLPNRNNITIIENLDKKWKNIYTIGAISALLVIILTVLDILTGLSLSGSLSAIPQTAVERFILFQSSPMLGLYSLDMLNLITTVLLIPTYFALCSAHRRVNISYTLFATVIYFIGAAVFITNNSALPMLELANKYASSTSEIQKSLLAAAGESLVATGAHGSLGAFPGFFILCSASLAMSIGMLKGKVFSKLNSYLGIIGSILLMLYLVLITFVPALKDSAMVISAPGGILALLWMIMFDIRLFKLGYSR